MFGVHPAAAVGTDLLYAAATKTGGSLIHGFSRTVDWKIVGRLAAGSVPASAVCLFVLSRFDLSGGAAGAVITTALGVGLYLTALVLIFRRRILAAYAARFGDLPPRRTALLTVMVGAVLGILVSISSVGAGAMGVTALVLLYPRLPTSRIVGTDIAHAVPLTLVGGLGYWILGSVDWQLLGALLIGSLPGIVVGSYLATRVPETSAAGRALRHADRGGDPPSHLITSPIWRGARGDRMALRPAIPDRSFNQATAIFGMPRLCNTRCARTQARHHSYLGLSICDKRI